MRDTVFLVSFLTAIVIGIYYYNGNNSRNSELKNNQINQVVITPLKLNTIPQKKVTPHQNEPVKNIYSIYKPETSPLKETDEKMNNKEKGSHGVPFLAWVRLNRNKIFLSQPIQADTNDLRVFIQCMEFKNKGPRYLTLKECKALREKSLSHE